MFCFILICSCGFCVLIVSLTNTIAPSSVRVRVNSQVAHCVFFLFLCRGLKTSYTDRPTAACRPSYCQLLQIEGCRVVSATDPHGRIVGFLDQSRYYCFQVAPQLYSGG
jgi:hypothetical protein